VTKLARDGIEEVHAPVSLEDLFVDGERGVAMQVDIAEAASRFLFGSVARHALRDELVDAPLVVEVELVVERGGGTRARFGEAEDAAHERRLVARSHVAGSAERRSPTVSV
jgi:hypothetical protein